MGVGIGGYGSSAAGRTRIELRDINGTVVGTISFQKSNRKTVGRKRRVPYNFKKISARILKAKTSGSASRVVTMARNEIAMLRRKLRSSEYNDKELEIAILHAERMERVAKKRLKNLRQEERAQKGQEAEEAEILEEDRENSGGIMEDVLSDGMEMSKEELEEMICEMEELMRESMEESSGLKELTQDLMGASGEMAAEDLELLKKKHRAQELREITDADMKYLKAMFQLLKKEKESGGNISPVSLELGGTDISIAVLETPVMAEGGSVDVTV